jgi:hypothetical protein
MKQHVKQQCTRKAMHETTTHKVVAHEACSVLCEKSYNSMKRDPTIQKELQQHEKINSSMREAIQLKKNSNNTRGAKATQEEQKQCQ